MKTAIFSILLLFVSNLHAKSSTLKNGKWHVELQLDSIHNLPFEITVKSNRITIINGNEEIELNTPTISNDTISYKFPYFNSQLIIHSSNAKEFTGYWLNLARGKDYKIPVIGKKSKENRFGIDKNEAVDFSGKWQTLFNSESIYSFEAIGLFDQKNNSHLIEGTFLTETGDFRFLSGNVDSNKLYLSCFDGSHAFLFEAVLNNDTIIGDFYSGTHYHTTWKANKNENFELGNPNELTYLKDNETLSFNCKTLDKKDYSYPNDSLTGKVVIIQIMGSWCPNCLDETILYKELFDKYHEQGLEVVSVCYEIGDDFDSKVKNVERLKNKLETEFTYLIGGYASKEDASKQFSALNGIMSFPTSIIIDSKGNVNTIHTGFSGPATGMIYNMYKEKLETLIKELLAD